MTDSDQDKRTRLIEWVNPSSYAHQLPDLSGVEFIRAVLSGDLPPPPVAKTLGYQPEKVEQGRTEFSLEPGEHLINPIGTVHGGILGTLLDTAMGSAIWTSLPKGKAFITLEYKVNFIQPVIANTGKITAVGECLSVGARTATARADIRDRDGNLMAHATCTCMIRDVEKKAGN